MPIPESKKTNRAKQRQQVGLDNQLENHLQVYESAARGATATAFAVSAPMLALGLCVFAWPQTSLAEVVCTAAQEQVQGDRGHLLIDLNNDGINDVSISAYSTFVIGSDDNFARSDFLGAKGLAAGNAIAADIEHFALAGLAGEQLGSDAHFFQTAVMGRHGSNLYGSLNRGPWRNVTSRRFLGVKFLISGETHYGFIRFSSSVTSRLSGARANVTGYSYETVANQPIVAGACSDEPSAPETSLQPGPGSLGQLAAGAAGR